MYIYRLLVICVFSFILFGCDEENSIDQDCVNKSRGQYPDQETSMFILPWLPGEAYKVGQGNCSSNVSHLEGTSAQFAYDFLMPIGTSILAAREGVVLAVEESYPDSTRKEGENNFVVIKHYDDSLAVYGHLTTQGAIVEEGDIVEQGQLIGISGDSGASTAPHLHFHVQTACASGDANCISNQPLPVTFKNTEPHPNGLVQGETYSALPWE